MDVRSPTKIYDDIQGAVSKSIQHNLTVSKGMQGAITGMIEKFLRELRKENESTSEYRRMIFGWLFGELDKPLMPLSSHDMKPEHFYAIQNALINLAKVEDTWAVGPSFRSEIRWLLTRVLYDFNRSEPGKTLRDILYSGPDEPMQVEFDLEQNTWVQDAVANLGGVVTFYTEEPEQLTRMAAFDHSEYTVVVPETELQKETREFLSRLDCPVEIQVVKKDCRAKNDFPDMNKKQEQPEAVDPFEGVW